MKTIAIVNRRGGVGKTATAHALGAGLALRGYKVLFVDLDSQTNLTFDAGADEAGQGSYEVLTKQAKAKDAIQHVRQADIIPGSPSLATIDLDLQAAKDKSTRLKDALREVSGKYDFCIIDTPPALGTLPINALTAADGAIITAQAEIHSVQGISHLWQTITAVKDTFNAGLAVYGILLTRYNARAIVSKEMTESLEVMAAALHTKVFATPIRECTAVKEAQACSLDIFTYAPKSNAAKDYAAFIDELLQAFAPET